MPSIDEIAAKYGASGGDKYDALASKYGGALSNAPTKLDPTDGMSTTDKVLAGVGKSMSDTAKGMGQLARDYLLPTSLSDKLGLPTQADADATKQRDAALMNTGAGTAGYLGGTVASALLPMGVTGVAAKAAAKLAQVVGAARTAGIASSIGSAADAFINPATYKAAAAAGILQGAMQPVGTSDSRGFNMAVGTGGGLLGNGIANGIGRIAQPFKNQLDELSQKAVDTFRNSGIPLDAAQMTGSPLLARIKSSFSDNPFMMGAQANFNDMQKSKFGAAVLKTIGEDSPVANQATMGDARSRIGNVFDDVSARNPVNYDTELESALAQHGENAGQVLNDTQMTPIKKQLSQIVDKSVDNGGALNGSAYQNLKQNLDTLSGGADTMVGGFARDIRGSLDDALQRSTLANGTPEDFVALMQARQQWGNMRKIEGTIDKDGLGQISAAKLAGVMGQKANRNASIYGMGDQTLVDLANSGNQLLKDKTPNSGSIARMAMQVAPSLIAGGVSGVANGDWIDAAKTAGTVAALPKLAQFLMNNPTAVNYLVNGIKPGMVRGLLDAPESIPMLGGFMRRSLPGGFRTGLLDTPSN